MDSAYNAFTAFDVILDNCTLDANAYHSSVIDTDVIENTLNPRPELQAKCLPNIVITNLQLNFPAAVTEFSFIRLFTNNYTGNFQYMNTFLVDVIEVTQAGASPITINDANVTINLAEPLRRNINMNRNLIGA
jgi:hypothetical protein